MYKTNWGIVHGLKVILEAHKGLFTGQLHKGLYEILTMSWHAELSLNLAMLGSLTIVVAHHMYSMSPYPYLAADYGTQLLLFTHHMWIGGFLIVGAAAHATIFMVRDYDPTTQYNDLLDRVLRHRDAIISLLSWACIFLGFHSFGLYIHNDTMSALGTWYNNSWCNSKHQFNLEGGDLVAVGGKVDLLPIPLGIADFLDPYFGQPTMETFTRGGALSPVNIAYSGVYQWWYTIGLHTNQDLYTGAPFLLFLSAISLIAGHLVHVAILASRGEYVRWNNFLDVLPHPQGLGPLFTGFHTLGLYVHNDVMLAFGTPEKQILIEPIFSQWIQSAYGKTSYGFDVLLLSTSGPTFNAGQSIWLPGWLNVVNENSNSLFLTIGLGDFLVHHDIALGLHTTTLILVKGSLDARGSKLMPDKKDFGYSFSCDGPGRGGTCDILAWDGFYLAVFWMLNTIG
ncbi:Photosystem I chlorophyll a apoprotein A2 [Capsicum baccatum]|uniref:photosystem I n=1 Tax=Capsicum baccatum TaxID=33114 RepID=A0A2G2V314_CAPBA|nr:Photosystem I chlorophyll a apoprotein A2 [Capsicum baccatum]